MFKVEHCYYTFKGKEYKDVTVYFSYIPTASTSDTSLFAYDYSTYEKLSRSIDSLLNNTFVPNIGDEIYVAPHCHLAAEDIRHSYKVKRAPDAGTCNVFSPMKWSARREYYIGIVYFPNINTAVFWRRNRADDLLNQAIAVVGEDADVSDAKVWKDYSLYMSFRDGCDSYRRLLEGSLKKPCISASKLPIKANELTQDILTMALVSCSESLCANANAEKNAITTLMLLNQHNWRDYPGTMTVLFKELLRNRRNSVWRRNMSGCPSRYPKPIQEMINLEHSAQDGMIKFSGKKDYEMARQLVDSILNIGEKRFVDIEQIMGKLSEKDLGRNILNTFYKNIVKIEPKSYEEYESRNPVC